MSGLESLAVLGIACNVMQIISFGRETVATCRTVFRTGSVDPDLDVIVGHLNRVLLDVKTTMSSAPNASDPAEKELFLIAEGCQKIASQLVDEVKAVTSAVAKGKGKPLLATWVVLKSKSREKKVKDLEKTLEGYQRTLEMGLLLKIRYV
jgi:hypothetical protein